MTEADRYLNARKQPQADTVPPHLAPDRPSNPTPTTTPAPTSTPLANVAHATRQLGIKWLSFVNFGLIPLNAIFLFIAMGILISEWDSLPRAGELLFYYIATLAILVAMFFGLKTRAAWGWWLTMVNLLVAAPAKGWEEYTKTVQRTNLSNDIYSALGSTNRLEVNNNTYVIMAIALFLVVCLPQLIYFYKRRGMFHVDL